MLTSAFAIVAYCGLITSSYSTAFKTKEAELTEFLIQKCSLLDKTRPTSQGEPLVLDIALNLYRFQSLASVEESFSVLADVTVTWNHPCVRWAINDTETATWASVRRLSLDPKTIWLPNIQHMNAVQDIYLINKLGTEITVFADASGAFTWQPMGLFQSTCALDLRSFPWDTQFCTLELEAWESTDNIVFGNVSVKVIDSPNLMNKGQLWTLIDLNASTYQKRYENYDDLYYSHASFSLKLSRLLYYYGSAIILPCMALTILQHSALLMEPKLPDRPVFSITTLLAFAVIQNILADNIPRTSELLLIAISISCQFVIGMLITIYNLIMNMLARQVTYRKRRLVIIGRSVLLLRFCDAITAIIFTTITLSVNISVFYLMTTK